MSFNFPLIQMISKKKLIFLAELGHEIDTKTSIIRPEFCQLLWIENCLRRCTYQIFYLLTSPSQSLKVNWSKSVDLKWSFIHIVTKAFVQLVLEALRVKFEPNFGKLIALNLVALQTLQRKKHVQFVLSEHYKRSKKLPKCDFRRAYCAQNRLNLKIFRFSRSRNVKRRRERCWRRFWRWRKVGLM